MHANLSLHSEPARRVAMRPDRGGTITDLDSGLTWTRETSEIGLDWFAALAWVGALNTVRFLSHDDWRLPNAHELDVFRNRFPASVPPGAARIRISGLGCGGVAEQTLRRAINYGSPSLSDIESGIEAAPGMTEQLQSPARDDHDLSIPGFSEPGLLVGAEDQAPRLVRIYDRVPLVRDAAL